MLSRWTDGRISGYFPDNCLKMRTERRNWTDMVWQTDQWASSNALQ